jgi:signal transduction histidine kinase
MFFAIRATLTPKSIRAQLSLWYVLMLASALAAFAVLVFVVRARTLYREMDADAEIRAHHLAASLQEAFLELDVPERLAADAGLAAQPAIVRTRTGDVVFQSPAFPPLRQRSEGEAIAAARDGDGLITVEDRAGGALRLVSVVIERTGAPALVVQLAAPTDGARRILGQLAGALALLYAIVLFVASYGGSFIARRALRPVDAIVGRVREIQASRLGDRLDQTGSEELDRLVETLNRMLDRLETSMRGARRFAADASHELQTPIAAMRAAVDVSLRTPASLDYQDVASGLLTDLDRLSTLVRDLRLLALADAGHLLDTMEAVDLTAVVGECCDIVRAIAEPRRITISVDILSRLVITGSSLHLRRALLNLAHNAVRYSPDGAAIQITVGRLDREAVLAIVDEGCGITAADLPHIFERFYRADPARARETGGTGLGLAIADQIVRVHGGRIEVSSLVGQGSTFVVFLPLAAASDLPPADPHPAQTINAR